jgi:hypothetical protein
MKTLFEIKQSLLEKKYTKKNLKVKINLAKLAILITSEITITLISTIPFIIGFSFFEFNTQITIIYVVAHFLFYVLYLKKSYKKELLPTHLEAKLELQALREIKSTK